MSFQGSSSFTDPFPAAERAAALDERMRERLAKSLESVFESSKYHLPVDPVVQEELLAHLRAVPLPPVAFALYAELVFAIEEDDLQSGAEIIGDLIALPREPEGTKVHAFADPSQDARSARILHFMDSDPDLPFTIDPPSDALFDAFCDQLDHASEIIQDSLPEFDLELSALLREIIIAADSDEEAAAFDATSSCMLWGTVLLKIRADITPVGIIEALARESGHALLLGLCAEGPLTENDDERFESPLYKEAQPVSVLLQTAFISARVHSVLEALGASPNADKAIQAEALAALPGYRKAYQSAAAIVTKQGQLTELGKSLAAASGARMPAAKKSKKGA